MRRVLAGCLLVVAACSGGEGSPSVVKDLSLTASQTGITVGASTQITALALDASGGVIEGAHVTWTSVTPQVLSVNGAGLATGLSAGQGTIRGATGGKTADITIQVSNPPAVSVAFDKDALTLLLPAGTTTLVPIVKAAGGVVIANPTLFYSSDAPKVASVNQLGVVTAVAAGVATITGATEGLTGSIRITVTANATATSPKITAVTPLVAGGNAVLTGTGFATSIAGNAVLVDGIPATVTAATSTQLNITVPTGGWACEPQRTASVQVNANNEVGVASATLRIANLRTLAVGQSVVVSNASEVRCNELAGTGGTYLVSVYNPSRTMSNNGVTFALRGLLDTPVARQGARGDAVALPAPRAVTPTYPAIGSRRFSRWQAFGEMQRSDDAHADIMQRSIDFARRTPRRQRASLEAAIPAGGATAHQVTQLGSITALKIPNLDAQNFCSTSIAINARTAWVGAHAVIVEDTVGTLNGTPTLRGQLDSLYAVIGQEFESTMWPILTGNFGNPLAMDQQLSRTGKIVMLFSPRINTLAGGTVAGFVVSCDFFPVSQAASSNVGEYFYAIMPTSTAAGISAGTKDSWMRSIRSTIIHEAKHITAFGERLARNAEFEELWLEEGTARHAEELYGRSIYGVPWKGNTGYQASVFCDVRPASASAPQCAGRPVLMLRHFDALYQYLQSPEPYSVLGRVAPGEATFYASSWSVVRWMIDHFATTEPAFLQGMVQGTQSGVAGLEARTGKTWEEMLGEWSLALAVDDYPGVVFQNARLRFPTWNLRDEFKGMCGDFGPCVNPANPQNVYPLEFPLQPRALTGGAFSETVNFLNAGSFTMWSLTGPTAGPQMLEVRAVGGGEPPSQLRIAIVRVN